MADRPEVVLPGPAPAVQQVLQAALAISDSDERRAALGGVIASDPTFLAAWAHLSEIGRDPVERYACARVGYHRGLDALRAAGWGGVGRVRWDHDANRGFLRCLALLRDAADVIGEQAEVSRINSFLVDLDPMWDDDNTAALR